MKPYIVSFSLLFIFIMIIISCLNPIPNTATLILKNDSDKIVDIYIESTKNNISESFPLQVEINISNSKEIALSWKEFGDVEVHILGTYIDDTADKNKVFYVNTIVTLKNGDTLKKTITSIADEK